MLRFYKNYRGVIRDEKLTKTQKTVYSILINRAEFHNGNKFYCFESWIAEEAVCSIRTVKRAIKHLEELGYIHITKSYNKADKKTTNYYTVNFEWQKGKMVAETGTSGEGDVSQVSTPVVETKVVKLSAIQPEPTYNEVNEDVDIKDCKVVAVEINKEVLNNVLTYLKRNLNEAKRGMIYFPAVKNQYGYDYKTVVEAVRVLADKGYINYDPQEKEGKLFHFYSISSGVITNEKKYEETIGKWIDLCRNQISKLNADSTEDERKLVFSTLSNYAGEYIVNGVTKEDLKNTIQYVYKKMIA